MSSYTPGLTVTPRVRHRVRRLLPIAGDVQVNVGDRVDAQQVVAATELPGDVFPTNVANQIGVPAGDLPGCMLVKEGNTVAEGDILARSHGMFGFFKTEFASRAAGVIESVSEVTGQVLVRASSIPVEVKAYLSGEVIEILPGQGCDIEAEAALIQGIFGIGGEVYGTLQVVATSPDQPFDAISVPNDAAGKVLVGGARITREGFDAAVAAGAVAIVSGGIDDADLKAILGYDLGVAVTGTEQVGLTLIVTEGFGDIAMARRTFELLQSHTGSSVAVNGTTQIRAGVLRPEILIPLAGTGEAASDEDLIGDLIVDAAVRVIRDPYFGVLGRVTALPHEPEVLGSGSKARVLNVKTSDGRDITVPRANVELIGGLS